MRLVKNHINEKFTEESDPIRDMGIGYDHYVRTIVKRYYNLFNTLSSQQIKERYLKKYSDQLQEIKDLGCPDFCYVLFELLSDLKEHSDTLTPNIIKSYIDDISSDPEDQILTIKIKNLFVKIFKDVFYIDLDLMESINEKFIEDSDPIRDMGIGSLHYYEKRMHEVGTTTYREMHKKYFSDYTFDYDDHDMGWILYHFLFYFCEEKLDIKLTLDKLFKNDKSRMEPDIKECMQIISDTLKKHFYVDIDPYLETYLEHVSESINEKFSENGDPIDNMDIGIKSLLKKKYIEMGRMSEAEIYDLYFRPFMIKEWTALGMVLYLILKYITEKDLPFQDAFENALFNLNYHRREPEILKAVRKKMADVLEKHFRIIVNSDIINIVNEKFTEDTDAIHDMGIGMDHLIKKWIEDELYMDYKAQKEYLLSICVAHNKFDFVKYLVEQGVNVKGKYGSDALQTAAAYGYLNIVKYLIDQGADPLEKDSFALRWAARNGHYEIVKILLDAGADPHARGNYALKMARIYGHKNIIKLLQKYSSDQTNIVKESINEKFKEDSDPIHDLGIGGISFEEKRKETIGSDLIKSSEWLDYLRSLIGKTITGDFGENGIKTFKICHSESYHRGTRLNFYDEDNNLYLVQSDKRYIIR